MAGNGQRGGVGGGVMNTLMMFVTDMVQSDNGSNIFTAMSSSTVAQHQHQHEDGSDAFFALMMGDQNGLMGGYGHLVLELILLIAVLYLLLQKSSKTMSPGGLSYSGKSTTAQEPLTEEEVDELCREWKPEPLAPRRLSKGGNNGNNNTTIEERILSGPPNAYTTADGKRVLNLVSTNFLGVSGSQAVSDACRDAIRKYGVGSAGPRGFYGTIDVHLELERRLAAFFRVDEAILYSFGVATMTSLIPAYAKRGDVIVCDAGVNYALQSGVILSRSTVKHFKHNDVRDLERVMREYASTSTASDMEDNSDNNNIKRKSGSGGKTKKKTKLRRMFVVVEGIYQNYGDIARLDAIVPLCRKYKFRLMIDESLSVGVLGATGRGCFEHHNMAIPRDESVIIAASMSNALGSVGGFCVGDKEVIAHQRLGGNGYVFSASLPPFLASAGLKALDMIDNGGNSNGYVNGNDTDKSLTSSSDSFTSMSDESSSAKSNERANGNQKLTKRGSKNKIDIIHSGDNRNGSKQAVSTSGPHLLHVLHENASIMRAALHKIKTLEVVGDDMISPVIHVRVKNKKNETGLNIDAKNSDIDYGAETVMLNNVVNHAFKCNILLTMAKYSPLDREIPRPSIRIAISAKHGRSDLLHAAHVISDAASKHVS